MKNIIPVYVLNWMKKINEDRVGYHEAKGYSSRRKFKRNQRKGL